MQCNKTTTAWLETGTQQYNAQNNDDVGNGNANGVGGDDVTADGVGGDDRDVTIIPLISTEEHRLTTGGMHEE